MATEKIEIQKCLNRLYQRAEQNKNIWSEEDLRIAFIRTDIFKLLGYEDDDVRFEKAVPKKGKRTDVECLDKFGVVTFVVEFKKPSDPTDLKAYQSGLWNKYVLPLKARHGVLTNGLQLILYERIGVNLHVLLDINLEELTSEDCDVIFDKLQKTPYVMEKLDEVAKHFKTFSKTTERKRLMEDLARDLFYKDFSLEKGTHFSRLVRGMIELFDHQIKKESFLSSAYDFWKRSYARKPEKVPKNWKPIMVELSLEDNEENLHKFMFCLETAYALFTRLILAKTCEDYGFPNINLYRFLERDMKTREYGGEITAVGWGISLVELIDALRYELVESIFEEDIFYWWTDEFSLMRKDRGEFLKKQYDKVLINVSMSIRDIIYAIYTYDFSEIAGDPLGDLYQKYFDKDTRKALGEFYTPKEVVNYILDAVGYKGQFILEKRLLDPATGSGTFIVDALHRYLDASKPIAEEKGWGHVIKKLCNEFHIVAFDIHPFATIMAQIHFMLELLPYYKEAVDDARKRGTHFTLRRIPIFRTDSLVNEEKGVKVDWMSFEVGKKDVILSIPLPIKKEIEDKKFIEINVRMPRSKEVIGVGKSLKDIPEYFCALQAIFDVVKHQAKRGKYEIDPGLLERAFKEYLEDKNWDGLVNFFTPYSNEILKRLEKFREPPYKFGNGRLVKSIEDMMLAGLLKNYVQYDFVVGNPPYVRVQALPYNQREYYKNNYETAYKQFDLYILFVERGMKWLKNKGYLGFITSNKFTKREYGKRLRNLITRKGSILQFIDLTSIKVFRDAANDPCIFVFQEGFPRQPNVRCVVVKSEKENLLGYVTTSIQNDTVDEHIQAFSFPQEILTDRPWLFIPPKEYVIFVEIETSTVRTLGDVSDGIHEGLITGGDSIFIVDKNKINTKNLEIGILKPIVKGENVRRWRISSCEDYVLYPYKLVDGKTKLLSQKEIMVDYPNIWGYLLEHKKRLEERYCVNIKGYRWYELHDSANMSWFEQAKIITPDISESNNFAYDNGYTIGVESYLYTPHTCYVINLKSEFTDNHLLIVGQLNSRILEFYFKNISINLGKKGFRYISQYLKQLPIRLPQTKKEQKIADRVTSKVNQILGQVKIEQRMDAFLGQYLEGYKGIELDEKPYTFKTNHKSLEPVITEITSGGFGVELGKKEEILPFETKMRARYVSIALKGKRVKKGEKIKVLIPKDESIIKEILEKYENDRKQLDALPISKLEEEINELVYKLYGLGEKDKKVIEEFLEKF